MAWRPAAGWFGAALALFALSAAHGPMWADSSKLTIYALASYLPSVNPGDHAGWTLIAVPWLAALAPLGAVRAAHLLSAFAGALAVALLFVWTRSASGSATRAHSAAALLLVALPHWWASTLAETYSVAVALVLGAALAGRRATALGAAIAGALAGLAAATHMFAVFLSAPLLLAQRPRRWPPALLGVALGTSPVWLALLRVEPDPLTGHLAGSASSWSWVLATFISPRRLLAGAAVLVALLAYALGPLGLLAIVRGRHGSGHPTPRLAAASLLAFALLLASYSTYRLHLMSGLVVLGLLMLAPPDLGLRSRVAHMVVQPALYIAVPALLVALGHGDLGARRLPGRSNAWYFLNPVKVFDNGPARYAHALLEASPPGAVVLADFNPGAVLALVQRTAGERLDVRVVPTAIDDALGTGRPVEVLAHSIRALPEGVPVVLADRWEPYYRVRELAALGLSFEPAGPGLRVIRQER